MCDTHMREAITEITASKALSLAEKKLATQLLHDHDAAQAENQKLRALVAANKKEIKHQEEYIESLKTALSVRVHDFGFTADTGIDGLLVISSLKKSLKQETEARLEAVEANKGLEDRLQSCKQTLSELLKSSQVAAKKLKQAHEKIDRFESMHNIWASELATTADVDKLNAKICEARELREALEDLAVELNISTNRPVVHIKTDILSTLSNMKVAMQIMDNELEQTKAENQDMTVIQEQLTSTVAEQEQMLERTKPLLELTQTEDTRILNDTIDDLKHQLDKMQLTNEELMSKLRDAELMLMRSTIDAAVGKSSITPEDAVYVSTRSSIQRLANSSSSSYCPEVTGSVINTTRAAESVHVTNAMKLSDLQPQYRIEERPVQDYQLMIDNYTAQINDLVQENTNLREDKRELERQLSDLRQLIEHKDVSIQILNAKEANSKAQLDGLIEENIKLTERLQLSRPTSAVPAPASPQDTLRNEVANLKAQIALLDRRLHESEMRNGTLASVISSNEELLQKSLSTVERLAKNATQDINEELAYTERRQSQKSASQAAQIMSIVPSAQPAQTTQTVQAAHIVQIAQTEQTDKMEQTNQMAQTDHMTKQAQNLEESRPLTVSDFNTVRPPSITATPVGREGFVVNYELGPGDQMDLQATETGHVLNGIIGGSQICITTAPLGSSVPSSRVVQSKNLSSTSSPQNDKNRSIRMTIEKVISTYRQFGIELPNSMTELEADMDFDLRA